VDTFGEVLAGALTPSGIESALGYVAANRAGDSFLGPINAPSLSTSSVTAEGIDLLPSGTAGGLRASKAFVPGYTGIVEFLKSDHTRNGFVGFNPEAGAMQYASDTGAGHNFQGGPITLDDANIGIKKVGADPVYMCDANDYFYYSRSTNQFIFTIGGTNKASIDSGGVMSVTELALDGQFYQVTASGNPTINFDSGGDALIYNRSANTYQFAIGGSSACNITATGLTANGLSAPTISVDANFYLSIASSQPRILWDASDSLQYDRTANALTAYIGGSAQLTVNPSATFIANVLQVGDANFGLNLNGGGQPLLAFESGAYFSYNRTSDIFAWVIGNASKMSLDSTGGLSTVGPIFPGNDSAFSMRIASGNPTIVFDSGDTLRYDRSSNKFIFSIGSVDVASIDASGNLRIKGSLSQGATP
jgi:hypothetical protein